MLPLTQITPHDRRPNHQSVAKRLHVFTSSDAYIPHKHTYLFFSCQRMASFCDETQQMGLIPREAGGCGLGGETCCCSDFWEEETQAGRLRVAHCVGCCVMLTV